MSLTDQEVLDGRDDLAMLRRPHLWPYQLDEGFSMVALKRRTGNQVELSRMFYYELGADWSYVFLIGNMLSASADGKITGGSELVQLVIEAGWVID